MRGCVGRQLEQEVRGCVRGEVEQCERGCVCQGRVSTAGGCRSLGVCATASARRHVMKAASSLKLCGNENNKGGRWRPGSGCFDRHVQEVLSHAMQNLSCRLAAACSIH